MDFIPLTITSNTSVPKFTAKFDKILLFLDLLNDLKFTEEKYKNTAEKYIFTEKMEQKYSKIIVLQ
jgi:hypothetical protein